MGTEMNAQDLLSVQRSLSLFYQQQHVKESGAIWICTDRSKAHRHRSIATCSRGF